MVTALTDTAHDLADVDVVIIGAGAGGSAAAWALTRLGRRVLVIDAGPRFDPAKDYRLDQPDWERTGFPHKRSSQGQVRFAPLQRLDPKHDDLRSWNAVQGHYTRENTHRTPSGPGYHHVRGVGGSTLAFTGEAHRMNPHSMKMRSRFGVGADWPFDYDTLEPWYCEAEEVLGVAGPTESGDRWRSRPYPLPAHPLSPASRFLGQGFAALGLSWVPNSRAALSRPYDGRPDCNYCGNCTRGCPRRDKGSADLTFMAKAESTGRCRILTETQVLRIETHDHSVATRLLCADRDGQHFYIPLRQLVLAAGAIETPRLLLGSATEKSPAGLGNEHGQVGNHLLETLAWVSTAVAPLNLRSFAGLPADAICWDFNRPDAIPGITGGCRFSAAVQEMHMVGPLAYAQRVLPGWGHAHKRGLRALLGTAVSVGAIGESLPHAGSRVDLAPDERDSHGMPLARIHSRLDELAIARLRFMADTSRSVLRAAGCEQLVEEHGTFDHFSSTHLFGTCRMGSSPQDSVCDEFGKLHSYRNIHICDTSILPSSGGGESPSLSVQAIALRNMTRLSSNL